MITVNLDKMLWERHMKLSELSEKVGISMTNLSLLKTGKPAAAGPAVCAGKRQDQGTDRQ